MRRIIFALLLVVTVTGCTSLLFGNRLQSAVLGALFESVVGFNPNDVQLLENPAVKSRMTAMLGDKYEPTVKLLREAQKIQRDGAVFYLLAKAAPIAGQAIAGEKGAEMSTALLDNAGMSWDSNLNKFSVLLIKDGVPEIFSEPSNTVASATDTVKDSATQTLTDTAASFLPADIRAVYDQAKVLDDKRKKLTDPNTLIESGVKLLQQ